MEKLKSALADKIIDISSTGGENMKIQLEKITRFRDFANACQSLMEKYPHIEDELLAMVRNDDFDTKVASSRVDATIRLSDPKVATVSELKIESDISELQQITEEVDVEKLSNDYTEYENVDSGNIQDSPQTIIDVEVDDIDTDRSRAARKENIRKVIQISGVVFIIIVVIFIVKFVIHNWQTILWILAASAVIAILIRMLVQRNKNK